MGTDNAVIKEFLVGLGFSVDQPSLKKFKDSLDDTTKLAKFAGGAIAGVAVAAEVMVTLFANQMEKLYYASKRSDASVQNIQALEYGFKQIGLAAGVATNTVENVARAIRSNPGFTGLLHSLGVPVEGRDKADVLRDLVVQLNKMPFYVASQFAQMFGIDPDTLLMIQQGQDKLNKSIEYRLQLNKEMHIDSEKAAEDGVKFANTQDKLLTVFSVVKDGLAIRLLPWFQEFTDGIVMLLPYLDKMIDKVGDAYHFSKGLAGIIIAAAHGDWQGVKEAATDAGKEMRRPTRDIAGIAARANATNQEQLASDVGRQHEPGEHYVPPGAAPHAGAGTSDVAWPSQTGPSPAAGQPYSGSGTPSYPGSSGQPTGGAGHGSAPRGLRLNNPGNIRGGGWSPAQDRDGFDIFNTPEQGLSALAGQLAKYNQKGLDTIQEIVSTYAPAKDRRNDVPAYVADLSAQLKIGANEVLNLGDPATMAKLMSGIVKHEQGYNPFSHEQMLSAAQTRLGAPTLNQTTTINVYGAKDPNSTAKAVGAEQKRVLGDATRNLAGALS